MDDHTNKWCCDRCGRELEPDESASFLVIRTENTTVRAILCRDCNDHVTAVAWGRE